MYLLQVVSRPPPLGIESDLFRCVQLAKEVQFYFKIYGGLCLSVIAPPLMEKKICKDIIGNKIQINKQTSDE
jgi:hypothetical protein